MLTINRYELATISAADRARLLNRSQGGIEDLVERVRPIVAAVRKEGDAALLRYTHEFDGVDLDPDRLRVQPEEFVAARALLDPTVVAALERAITNVRAVHERQLPKRWEWQDEIAPGVFAGEKITPITSVGLYVPRGKGAFPSVLYMLAIPAVIAGVARVVVCTPPAPDGSVDPATLVAAGLCGVDEVYRVGGPQAIAALAYGTPTIARVHKITGPGSGHVSAAKRILYGTVDVGLPAGPSEAIILADIAADPELVARDLLIEAEHGADSSSLLVTDSTALADAVVALLPGLIEALPRRRREFCEAVLASQAGSGGVMVTRDMASAIEFVNDYAPEHLEVQVADEAGVLARLRNAGEILLGPYTPISVGNFTAGTNAILPTGGAAHTYSCTSVHDFLKSTGIARLTREGYEALADTTHRLAEFEGFPAHAAAVRDRPLIPVAIEDLLDDDDLALLRDLRSDDGGVGVTIGPSWA